MKVLKEDAKIKHKFDVAKGFVQSKLTYFRGEERRRVSINTLHHNIILLQYIIYSFNTYTGFWL